MKTRTADEVKLMITTEDRQYRGTGRWTGIIQIKEEKKGRKEVE